LHLKKLKSLFKDCPTAQMKREEQAEVEMLLQVSGGS
jgi:hypothetical protein